MQGRKRKVNGPACALLTKLCARQLFPTWEDPLFHKFTKNGLKLRRDTYLGQRKWFC